MPEPFPFCGNFNFLVEIDDFDGDASSVVGGFSQVSGLESSSEVLEFKTGSQPLPTKIPGRVRFANIVLKRGVTSSAVLWEWRRRIERGEQDLRSGAVVLLDAAQRERARWNFHGAWPVRYEGPFLDSQDAAISVETLELSIESMERVETARAG